MAESRFERDRLGAEPDLRQRNDGPVDVQVSGMQMLPMSSRVEMCQLSNRLECE